MSWSLKNAYLSPARRKNTKWMFSNLRVSTFQKSMVRCPNGQFFPKFSHFTDQNGPKGGPHENQFRLFSNTKINNTNREEKEGDKNGFIFLVTMFPDLLMVHKLSKKHILAKSYQFGHFIILLLKVDTLRLLKAPPQNNQKKVSAHGL